MRLFPTIYEKMSGFVRLLSLFYICPVFFFIVGKISFFRVRKYSKFLLASFSLRSLFMDSKNSKYSPLPHRFKRIFHGFLLASSWLRSRLPLDFSIVLLGLRSCFVLTVRSQLIFAFSLCSLSVRSSVRLLINSGIDLKIVSELLGHSDVSTTANVYADVLKSSKAKVADLISLKLNGN